MSIIEKTIKEREDIIASVDVRIAKITELKDKIDVLTKELAVEQEELSKINVDVLVAEIEELKTYLPHPVEAVEEAPIQ